MSSSRIDRVKALRIFCAEIFGQDHLRGILIETDFEDINARKIEREFMQDVTGVTIQFSISSHGLSKLGSQAADDALALLMSGESDDNDSASPS